MNTPFPNTDSPGSGGDKLGRNPPPAIPDHTLLRMIGHGSYGEVWLARNVMGTYRAVKVVYRSTFDHDTPYEREFAGIRKFEPVSRSQESQVHILHIGRNDTGKYFYYVMELADDAAGRGEDGELKIEDDGEKNAPAGHSPSSILDPQSYTPRTLQHDIQARGRLPFAECLRISVALSNALNHLHQNGLVHRDIKPSNIIFVNGVPKLADIGLVTESEATLSYVGAQGFMPPEGPGRPTGDIYSLGKVIYELCTGRDRLDFPALPTNFGDWPDREQILELIAISLKACEPDRAQRYASADELIADLLLVQAGKSLQKFRWLERNRRWAVAAAVLALVLAAGAWVIEAESRSREREREDMRRQEASRIEAASRLRERTRQREVWMREAQLIRLGEHTNGWSGGAMRLLAQAGKIELDDELRTQAAANLNGVDANAIRAFDTEFCTFLAFDSKGQKLLVAGPNDGGHAKIWDWQTSRSRNVNSTDAGPVWFDRDGNPRQFICDESGVCWLLNLENGQTIREFHSGDCHQTNTAQILAVSKDGKYCAAFTNHLAIWEVANGRLITNLLENCTAVAFAPDNSCFASGDEGGNVHVRTLPDLSDLASFHQGNQDIHCLAFGRDPTHSDQISNKFRWWLSSGDSGGTVNIYQIAERKVKAICRGSYNDVYATAFSPDGMTLASGAHEYGVKLWDVATGNYILNIAAGGDCRSLVFSSDGSKLAVGDAASFSESHVHVIALERGRGVAGLRGLSTPVSKVVFSHDGQHLAALANDWKVAIWHLASNRLERVIEAPKGMYADNATLEFSPDDRLFALSTWTDTRLWNLHTGQVQGSWKLPSGLVQKLCFLPDGRLLQFQRDWSGNWREGACCLRELTATNYQTPLHNFPSPKVRVWDASFSPQGDCLVIIGEDAMSNDVVRVFNPLTGQELCALPRNGHSNNDWLITDPQLSKIGYWLGEKAGTRFFQMPHGEPWRDFPLEVAGALSPDGETLLDQRSGDRSLTVFKTAQPAWHLTLADGHPVSAPSSLRFSPNGRLIAWGTAEGTVFVCELEEVLRQLKTAGLGMPDH